MRKWVESGELVLLGITEEQHPDRCELFAQWKGFDFPILWDPFNLTGARAVPTLVAIDEYGIVRSTRPTLETIEEEFLSVDFPAPDEPVEPRMMDGACAYTGRHHVITPHGVYFTGDAEDETVKRFEQLIAEGPEDAKILFRAGVARRLRYDSPAHRAEDFQTALDLWTRALELDPNQYIWRRRIQQYGPRMDKPYPFYSWIEEARRELTERGQEPVALTARLTPAELAQPKSAIEAGADEVPVEPDPAGEIARDEERLVSIEQAIALDTSGEGTVASVHLTFRPDDGRDVHWSHEAGPPIRVWLDDGRPLLAELPARSDVSTSAEVEALTLEVELGEEPRTLGGYVLVAVCVGATGECRFLRQDFEVELVPQSPK